MEKAFAVAWAVVSADTSKGLNVVYYSLAHTRNEAYAMANRTLGTRFTTKGIRRMGYVAKRVRITLEE